jgi:hypothetical protein
MAWKDWGVRLAKKTPVLAAAAAGRAFAAGSDGLSRSPVRKAFAPEAPRKWAR